MRFIPTPEDADLTFQIKGQVTKLCPFRRETDDGFIRLVWRHPEQTPELHDLAEYLQSYADKEISHEAYVHAVRQDTGACSVFTTWNTAGFHVECST